VLQNISDLSETDSRAHGLCGDGSPTRPGRAKLG